jgi:ribonuclease P protein component
MDVAIEASSPSSPSRLRFPRSSRLLKHSSFEKVYKDGRRHFSASMTFFYLLRPVAGSAGSLASRAQIGFTVGRVLGGSVDRNRIKRRVRAAVRLNLPLLNQALDQRAIEAEIVINPKKSSMKTDPTSLQSEIARAFAVIAAAKPGDAVSGVAPQKKMAKGRS